MSARVLGGRYRLIREIARGGMAVVWEAQDVLLDRHVAVKLLHPQFANDAEFLERFRREARAAARLSHPNIVSIYDVGEDADAQTPFIVMELVEGQNLKDRIRAAGPLSDDEIRSIGSALAATLAYAHQRGIIHRDVKPQNVLLGEDERPRLTDFGIAQAVSSKGLTRTGAVMGSVQYLAPELVRGRPATAQSDVYGLGAVLYEMATGRVPFQGDTDLATALAHIEQSPTPPRAFNPRLAPDLERTILRALAKSPDERFHSAAELATELRAPPARVSPVAAQPRRTVDAPTQRLPTVPGAAAPAPRVRTPAAPSPARRTARPQQRRGAGAGVVALLLALAAVLVAIGAGFFGLATLNREPSPTPVPTAVPATAAPKPAVIPTSTLASSPTAAPQPSSTPEPSPSPSPLPSPSPVPLSPTPQPPPTQIPRVIAVPQLRGKTLDDARAALQIAGLTAIVRGVNANIDKNVVTDQAPDVNTTLPLGGTVTIVVGTGSTTIPDVSNLLRDQAIQTLQNNSFRVTTRDRRDPRIVAGNAIETTPRAGVPALRGSEVILDVSAGR